MHDLQTLYQQQKEGLAGNSYFKSLLDEAYRLKLISAHELEQIELQLLSLLAARIARYTNDESTSVRVETAQGIFQSTLYTIGVYLKSAPDIVSGVKMFAAEPLSQLYRKGSVLTGVKIRNAHRLYLAVRETRIKTDNQAYNDTVDSGLQFFFKTYEPDFAAHDTPAMIDYPLSIDNAALAGIEYIGNYLGKLFIENRFCRKFAPGDIGRLLSGYDENYRDLLINIYSIMLLNALGSILANNSPLKLNINPPDLQYLQEKLSGLSPGRLSAFFEEAATELIKELDITNKADREYLLLTINELLPRVENALTNKQPATVFITFKDDKKVQHIKFSNGQKLDDDTFRYLADEIRSCRETQDKIKIIKDEIKSLSDLVDILDGYCLFGEEYTEFFKTLGDAELALLYQKHLLFPSDPSPCFSEDEKDWQANLVQFFAQLDPSRRKRLEDLARHISLTDM